MSFWVGKMYNISIYMKSKHHLGFIFHNKLYPNPALKSRLHRMVGIGKRVGKTGHHHTAVKTFASHFHAPASSRFPYHYYPAPNHCSFWRDSQWLYHSYTYPSAIPSLVSHGTGPLSPKTTNRPGWWGWHRLDWLVILLVAARRLQGT